MNDQPQERETSRVVVYPPEAILTIAQVAAALQISVRQVERLDLPSVYLGERTRRFVWSTVLKALAERAA